MMRTATTIWFALAAILGPVLCCCPKAAAQSEPTAKKKHSCCPTHDDDVRPTAPKPADNCPCPMRTGAVEYTPVERITVDDATDFNSFASFLTVGEWTIESAAVCTHPTPDASPPIGGRSLLALYQILLI